MAKKSFKSVKVEHQGKEYFFVSKNGSFTPEDIKYYFEAQLYREAEHFNGPLEVATTPSDTSWVCPATLERIFLDDVRVMGMSFCKNKYGVSDRDISREVQRLNPGMKVKS